MNRVVAIVLVLGAIVGLAFLLRLSRGTRNEPLMHPAPVLIESRWQNNSVPQVSPETGAPIESTSTVQPLNAATAPIDTHISSSKAEPARSSQPAKSPAKPQVPAPQKTAPAPKEPIRDPLARFALGLVGIDPDAELYWLQAINDPDLSAHERQDLIEDLNEDGFPDPKNLTLDDLPLIINRIVLIEEIGSDAMDEVNADAFDEAYKDLLNMFARVTGQ